MRPAEPVIRTPPRRLALPTTTQVWRDVVFLHWPYAPDLLEHLVPRGTHLDLDDGVAWVGVVGLRMTRVRFAGLVPYGRDFNELNVRIYTVGADRRRSTVSPYGSGRRTRPRPRTTS